MAKKIESISTEELGVYLRTAETVLMKSNQVVKEINLNIEKLGNDEAQYQGIKVLEVLDEAKQVIRTINSELERRLKITFGTKTSGATLTKISKSIVEKLKD